MAVMDTPASQQEAFSLLANMAHRSRHYARGLPAQVDFTPYWSGVGFSLLGRRFVAPLGEVTETLQIPSYTSLPGVHKWIRGVANVRGRLLPLTDLGAFFDGQLVSSRRQQRVLVLELGELYSGLVVDSVFGMQHFPIDTFTEEIRAIDDPVQPFVKGGYVHRDVEWAVFSPHALAQSARFYQAAAD